MSLKPLRTLSNWLVTQACMQARDEHEHRDHQERNRLNESSSANRGLPRTDRGDCVSRT
jgi:hypothetical protein